MTPYGFLYDPDTKDDLVRNGDHAKGDTTRQNQELLLLATKGMIKQFPTSGVGVLYQLDDENPDDLMRTIRSEFVQDGLRINNLAIGVDGVIKIDSIYT